MIMPLDLPKIHNRKRVWTMIIERIERLEHYQSILPNLDKALTTMQGIAEWKEGERYPFDGGFLFFQSGNTKPLSEAQFEAHRKYIDIQVVLKGSEYVALEDLSNLSVAIPYSEDRDVEKYEGATQHVMKITESMAYVLFPWDAHKAVFHMDQPLAFTKAVIKLEVK